MVPIQRKLFSDTPKRPQRLSRSKIELFTNCARCFYLNVKHGIPQPGGFPFNLNSAVDFLLKKEFDTHRAKGIAHPLMKKYGIDAIPFKHKDLDTWRENFVGVQYFHEPTGLLITGAVDDIWVNPKGELHVVDYKATSKQGEVNIDADWQHSYKRQMEIYQWLLRKNGFPVSRRGYFVYCNGRKDKAAFDAKLEFDIVVIPYDGDDTWVEPAIIKAYACIQSPRMPSASARCDFCAYRKAVTEVEKV